MIAIIRKASDWEFEKVENTLHLIKPPLKHLLKNLMTTLL